MIENKSKNRTIAKESKFAKTIFSKFMGLMFSGKIKDKGLIFIFNKEKKISLHMFFVFYPIDVLWLNKDKKIVEIKENFKPFTIYNPKNNAKYIIELPQGTINKTNTELKDTITF